MLKSFFIIPVVKKNTRVKYALAVSAETPITLVKEIIDTPPPVAEYYRLKDIIKISNAFTKFLEFLSLNSL